MSGGAPRIRPATAADVRAFYGREPEWRLQALAVEDAAGRLLGIGGVEHQPKGLHAFMNVAPGVDPADHKRVLVRAARAALTMAAAARRPVFAIRDPDAPRSRAFLAHFGFAPLAEARQQEIWRCQEH